MDCGGGTLSIFVIHNIAVVVIINSDLYCS